MIQVNKAEDSETLRKFYDQIAKDSKQALIQLVSEAGHGKTSSLRTIIYYVKQHYPEIVFKIFDVSQAWYHCAPVKYRQLITREKWGSGLIANIDDCVYEMGSLDEEFKRIFVGEILTRDWIKRYQAKLEGKLDELPLIAYIFEEANIYFGSYALRRNDPYSAVFQNFVSVGRNFKMRGFLIATAEEGEMSPSLRRRSRKIYGRLESQGDLNKIRRKDKELSDYLKKIPRYNFVYYNGSAIGPVRIPDVVTNVPEDYIVDVEVVTPEQRAPSNWLWWVVSTAIIVWMFVAYFKGL